MFKNFPKFAASNRYKVAVTLYCVVIAVFDTWIHAISIIAATALGLAILPWMFNFIEKIALPGGFELTLKKAENALQDIPTDPVKEEEQKHSFLAVYKDDPQLALAGLRIEIEKRLRSLAERHHIDDRKHRSLSRLAHALHEEEVIKPSISSILSDMLPTLNQAVHAQAVPVEAGDWVLRNGPRLLAAIDDGRDFPFDQQDT